MPKPVTPSAFGKLVGLSKGRISQLRAEGLPVIDGMIDPDAGQAWLRDNLDPARREAGRRGRAGRARPARRGKRASGARKAPDGGGSADETKLGTVARLRASKIGRETLLLDLELRRRNGALVDRAEVERVVFTRARAERDQ
jgi:hypothetical protein